MTTQITLTLEVQPDGTTTIVRPDGENWPAPFEFDLRRIDIV